MFDAVEGGRNRRSHHAGIWGLLIYASPSQTDQLTGKLIMAGAAAMIVLARFADRPLAKAVLGVLIVGVAIFTGYVLLKWSGRL